MAPENSLPYRPGLEGVIAGETSVSRVDPHTGLIYRGYDIVELATHASFEGVVWLLLHGELPGMSQLAGWCAQVLEQQSQNRLLRPRSLYTGPARREYPSGIRKSAA
jgi:citrate synthase